MRKWTETVKPWPEVREGRAYRVQVTSVTKVVGSRALRLTFEFIAGPQTGRRMEVQLALPIRESGLTADFFRACGLTVLSSKAISPLDAVGSILRVCFTKDCRNNEWKPASFTPGKEDHNDGAAELQRQPR